MLPATWAHYRFNERSLPFAWGPAGGRPSEVEAVEFVIAAGPGSKGTLELSSPTFKDETLRVPLAIHASEEEGFPADSVFAAGSLTAWRATRDDAKPWWQIDFGRNLRFGGLVIHWPEPLPPRAFKVDISDDGSTWTPVYEAELASG